MSGAKGLGKGSAKGSSFSLKARYEPPVEQIEDVHPLVYEQRCRDIWMVLFAFRIINALCVRTFFQPDEYFQSLEPAWKMAFGPDSGAWITWEWEHQLRSSLHPALFAVVYYGVDKVLSIVGCFPQFRAMILSVLPNLVQALFASGMDFHTWQLADKIYGKGSRAGWAALFITVVSPWNWFCSTRTFSNCLETAFTIEALNYFPWQLSSDGLPVWTGPLRFVVAGRVGVVQPRSSTTSKSSIFADRKSLTNLRLCIMLACLACILRPTNALIWFAILMPVLTRTFSSSTRLQTSDYLILLREAVLVGSAVFALSLISDRLYFGEWTFPPYQFLYFNINQNLAVFYGSNDFHYYLSQGPPLLLTTLLPFGLAGIWKASSLPSSDVRFHLLMAILVSIGSLSLISHKEVRFIYPLLPLLHILAAPSLASFFTATEISLTKPIASSPTAAPKVREIRTMKIIRKPQLVILISISVLVSFYTATRHQRAPTTILSTLRHAYETEFLDAHGAVKSSAQPTQPFVTFLTPCHSTPWRTQLTYPSLSAWALTCSPPLTIPPNTPERAAYRDEADRFYDNMTLFLDTEVGVAGREWPPRYVVGFEGIEKGLSGWVEEKMKGKLLKEKWRVGNSDWHDDWRRVGDMVIWEFVDRV